MHKLSWQSKDAKKKNKTIHSNPSLFIATSNKQDKIHNLNKHTKYKHINQIAKQEINIEDKNKSINYSSQSFVNDIKEHDNHNLNDYKKNKKIKQILKKNICNEDKNKTNLTDYINNQRLSKTFINSQWFVNDTNNQDIIYNLNDHTESKDLKQIVKDKVNIEDKNKTNLMDYIKYQKLNDTVIKNSSLINDTNKQDTIHNLNEDYNNKDIQQILQKDTYSDIEKTNLTENYHKVNDTSIRTYNSSLVVKSECISNSNNFTKYKDNNTTDTIYYFKSLKCIEDFIDTMPSFVDPKNNQTQFNYFTVFNRHKEVENSTQEKVEFKENNYVVKQEKAFNFANSHIDSNTKSIKQDMFEKQNKTDNINQIKQKCFKKSNKNKKRGNSTRKYNYNVTDKQIQQSKNNGYINRNNAKKFKVKNKYVNYETSKINSALVSKIINAKNKTNIHPSRMDSSDTETDIDDNEYQKSKKRWENNYIFDFIINKPSSSSGHIKDNIPSFLPGHH